MNISAPFVRRPVATSLLAAAVLLAGAAAFVRLPVAPLPRVDFPTLSVQAALPGASPETMASAVATPLERRFGRIAGLTEMTSISSLSTTQLTLQFDLDRDVTAAARDVQAAINAAGAELPANLPTRPNYRKVNPADAPILIVSLTSETLPLAQVFDAANTVLAQKISQVEGVGQVTVGGGQQPAVRVQADPAALAGLGLGLDDVRMALAGATVNSPKGAITGPAQTYALQANDQLIGADAFRPLVVSYRGGAAVRLGDVAKVFDDVENNRVAAWANDARAVVIIIRRQPGANILDTIDRVKALLPSLADSISPAIDIRVAVDRARTIRASVHEVEQTLVIAIVLVVLVVLLFLRSLRATAIPSVAVPLSLIGTFGVMYLLGYSVNNLTLMALTISTGFVVDDAIVVTENVSRHIDGGAAPLEAALAGARQVGFTIVSITASLLAVFIPILFMGGMVGRLFREFAVTLSIAIALSALVSLTITPVMCARLLRPATDHDPGRLSRALERGFDALVRFYGRGLTWVLDHRAVMLLVTLTTLGFSVYLYVVVPKGLFPQQDTGVLSGFSEAPQDIAFEAMKREQAKLLKVLRADPDVSDVISFLGGQSGTTNTGNIFVSLKPRADRQSTADQIVARLRGTLANVPGIKLFLQANQDVRVGGRNSRTQYQYTLEDANLDELREWAPRVLQTLRGVPSLKDVNSDLQSAGLLLSIALDRDTASRLGVTPQAVDEALYDAFGQRQVATVYTTRNTSRVILEAAPERQTGPEALRGIYVRSSSGAPVPLSAIAHFSAGATSLSVTHQGQFPAITISFNLAPGVALGDAVTAVHAAERTMRLPPGLRASFQGTAQVFRASLDNQPLLVLAALLTVYIVLGMLYESLIHPITILSTLPSAGVGALIALLVTRTELSIIALIGIILLIGIVKKNAILMIDFAIEAERERGLSAREAIEEACLLRFRPILMTTMAALLGAIPLAIGNGEGAELRRPLGITIVGGLIFSQLLTLYTTPVVYLLLDRFTRRRPAGAGVLVQNAASSTTSPVTPTW
ncbi:MAG: multidrug efflux RND transporter permease subunit [Bacteroidota bacterium]